jgi:hypothetical protein
MLPRDALSGWPPDWKSPHVLYAIVMGPGFFDERAISRGPASPHAEGRCVRALDAFSPPPLPLPPPRLADPDRARRLARFFGLLGIAIPPITY